MRKTKKVGRNDPCPCGSGKKYKQCCGSTTQTTLSHDFINSELNRLHQNLLTFSTNQFEEELKDQAKTYKNPEIEKNETVASIFESGLILWMIMKLRFLKNQLTILELFYQITAAKLAPQIRRIFKQWVDSDLSVYEVTSIDPSRSHVTVIDISTQETYKLPYRKEDGFVEGGLLIGALVPFKGYHSFLLTILKLFGVEKQTVAQLWKKAALQQGGINEHFPEFLASALILGMRESDGTNPAYDEVAQRFAENLAKKDLEDSILIQGLSLWKEFCEREKPVIKNCNSYAAALEYYVHKHVCHDTNVTQGQLAEEYEVSSGTISTNYRKLTSCLPNN